MDSRLRTREGRSFDVAVIGGGIVGASIAYWLAPHRRVVLLEAEAAYGYHSTGRSAALYADGYGPPAIRALTRASREFFGSPPSRFTDVPLLRARGALFTCDDAHVEHARELYANLRMEQLDVAWLDGNDVRARVPILRPGASAAGVFDVGAFDIDVDALLQGFLRGARAQGATLLTAARVEELAPAGASRWRLRASNGVELSVGHVVNAAGAWADELARLAGIATLGIEPRRRTAFLFEPTVGLDCRNWPAVLDIGERWYFKPDAGLLLGSPANADLVAPHDVVPEELDVATGVYMIEQATTLEIGRPRRSWAGLRTFAVDGVPVCGPDPRAPAFFWAAALGGYGIQTAPAFGRLCADLLVDGAPGLQLVAHGVDPTAVSPDRFARL